MHPLLKALATILVSYTTHYTTAKLYNSFCVREGIVGFLQGLVTTGSPICTGGMEIMKHTQLSYSSMITMGASRLFVDLLSASGGK